MSELAAIEIEERDSVPVARISGEIDASNAVEIHEALVRAVSDQARGLVVDLTETSYLDSSGVQLLFDTAERLEGRELKFRVVVSPGSFIADVLAVTRLEETVAIDGTVSEAVDALSPG